MTALLLPYFSETQHRDSLMLIFSYDLAFTEKAESGLKQAGQKTRLHDFPSPVPKLKLFSLIDPNSCSFKSTQL